MRQLQLAAALVTALFLGGTTAPAYDAQDKQEKDVTVTGCVLKGDEGGFLLADLMLGDAPPSVPQPRVLYLLEDDDDLEGHTGHRVKVKGELEGELATGQIEIEREDDMVELEIKSDGRDVKIRLPEVPAAVGTSGSASDNEKKVEYVVRKLDVESITMVSSTCR